MEIGFSNRFYNSTYIYIDINLFTYKWNQSRIHMILYLKIQPSIQNLRSK